MNGGKKRKTKPQILRERRLIKQGIGGKNKLDEGHVSRRTHYQLGLNPIAPSSMAFGVRKARNKKHEKLERKKEKLTEREKQARTNSKTSNPRKRRSFEEPNECFTGRMKKARDSMLNEMRKKDRPGKRE